MAQTRLGRYEAEEGKLPALCMRCGAAANLVKEKTFFWYPSWINLLILAGFLCFQPLAIVGAILAAINLKRMRARVPLCDVHKNHWRSLSVYIYGGLAVLLILAVTVIVILSATENLQPFHCLGLVAAGFFWLLSAAIWQSRSIRATEITDRSITLIKVSPEFVDAVQRGRQDRGREFDEDEDRPRPRRQTREDRDKFYDPELPLQKPADVESFEEDEKGP